MKEIKLTQGEVALVDDEDYEYLNQFKWHLNRCNKNRIIYAVRKGKQINKIRRSPICMHRIIMNTLKGMEVDHIDHNGLNNQKSNLRNCTHSQNGMNKLKITSKTGYRGVYIDIKRKKPFCVCLRRNNKTIHLGSYTTLNEAALKYNEAAFKYFGEFAILNIIN